MNSQPQISEQPPIPKTPDHSLLQTSFQKSSSPQVESIRPQTSETVFFQIMDQVDEYDHLLKQMNDLYTEGMLSIANVKFVNPYSSLSTKGYKPTPAITKVGIKNDKQQKMGQFELVTQTKNIAFTNSVIDSQNKIQGMDNPLVDDENQVQSEAQSHSAHSSQSTANQLYSYEEEQLIIEEEQTMEQCRKMTSSENFFKQDFILDRFNIQSQKDIVLQAIEKFDQLLQKILQIAHKKHEIKKKFDIISQKSPNSQNPKPQNH